MRKLTRIQQQARNEILKKIVIANVEEYDIVISKNFIKEYGKEFGYDMNDLPTIIRRVGLIRQQNNLYIDRREKQKTKVEEIKKINRIELIKETEELKKKIVNILMKGYTSENEIAETLNIDINLVKYLVEKIRDEKYNITELRGKLYLEKQPLSGNHKKYAIDISKQSTRIFRFGAVSDNHINSKYERLDVLNALYDIFHKEGINVVYNGGNWIDGEARFNKQELINHGLSKQIDYFIDQYPQREGIKTYFIAGDDHEGWYWQREGVNIGEYMQMKAKQSGRDDLIYLGYVESDIDLVGKRGTSKLRIMHGGGGTAYALSYTPQKMIESFQGGEKPAILLLGHYHKADYFYYRNVHCVQLGCTQDQTTFMRKKKIQASIGGWILEAHIGEDGSVTRFKAEWITFYDKEYYSRQKYTKL